MQTISTVKLRGAVSFVLVFLVIELLDEVVFSAREAALPLIRDDLSLSYHQVGIFLSLPLLIANVIEPVLFMLAWNRKWALLVGAVLFGAGLLGVAFAFHFAVLLGAMIVLAPASGLFVGLAQATLMDSDPRRHEQNMARWTLAGSVGVVTGSLMLGAVTWIGGSWRELFASFAVFTGLLILLIIRTPFPISTEHDQPDSFREGLLGAWVAVRHGAALRWLILLQFSDLMLDILLSYLALYMVDVVGVDAERAAIAVAVWTGVGLLGDALLIPLLEKVSGLTYLRFSVWVELMLFPAFLLVPGYLPKLVILGVFGFFNSGWYAILQGRLYAAMPGQSSAVLALNSISGLVGGSFPFVIGIAAQQFGLEVAIWLLMAGPVALLVGLPRRE